MKKPLIASNFFSFPKLLLWSLPLGFFLVVTWFLGVLDRDTLRLWVWKSEEVVIEKVGLYYLGRDYWKRLCTSRQ